MADDSLSGKDEFASTPAAGGEEAARLWASVGHEIRTPLMGVVGMMELLGRTPLNDAQRRLLATAQESSSALMRIVDDVLDLAMLKTNRFKLAEKTTDVADVVENCAELLSKQAEAKGLLLACNIEPDVSQVVCDPVRLLQVLLNLGTNAIKYTESGAVELSLSTLSRNSRDVALRITVADTGIGIPRESQAFLFEPFTQLASVPGRAQGGVGLGLAICRNLVKAMGGTIALDSNPGAGTRCHVDLMLPVAVAVPPAVVKLEGTHALMVHGGENVMAAAARHMSAAGVTVAAVGDVADLATRMRALGRESIDTVVVLGPTAEKEDVLAAVDALERMMPQLPVPLIWLHGRTSGVANVSHRHRRVGTVAAYPLRRSVLLGAVAEALSRQGPVRASTPEQIDNSRARENESDASQARAAGRLVLVAEDNPINQEVLRQQLAILGYDADVVGHGREALRALRSQRYRLLLCDCHMPDMDGFELARQIRTLEKAELESGRRVGRMPIVAITANALPGDADRCREAGMDDYLTKPIEIRSLQSMLGRWVAAPYQSHVDISAVGAAVSPHPETQVPGVLDLSGLCNVYGNDVNKIASVLEEWQTVTARALAEMRQSLSADGFDGALAAAHRLKGSAGIAGAHDLSAAAAALELSLRTGNRQAVAADAENVERVAAAAMRDAREWSGRISGQAA